MHYLCISFHSILIYASLWRSLFVGVPKKICGNYFVVKLHRHLIETSYESYRRNSRPIFLARSSHVLSHPAHAHVSFFARVDPRPRRHATTGQGQARSRPTYRTDRRPALNFIHTPRGRLSVLTRNTKRRSHGSDDMAIRRHQPPK